MRNSILLALAALLAPPAQAQTSTPQQIKLQGFLSDTSGGPKVPASGTFQMTFELFDAETGGLSLATVGPMAVDVTGGLYEAELPFAAESFDGKDRFLQITVAGELLSPRVRIFSAPFAYVAERLEGYQAADLEESAEIAELAARPLDIEQDAAPTLGGNLEAGANWIDLDVGFGLNWIVSEPGDYENVPIRFLQMDGSAFHGKVDYVSCTVFNGNDCGGQKVDPDFYLAKQQYEWTYADTGPTDWTFEDNIDITPQGASSAQWRPYAMKCDMDDNTDGLCAFTWKTADNGMLTTFDGAVASMKLKPGGTDGRRPEFCVGYIDEALDPDCSGTAEVRTLLTGPTAGGRIGLHNWYRWDVNDASGGGFQSLWNRYDVTGTGQGGHLQLTRFDANLTTDGGGTRAVEPQAMLLTLNMTGPNQTITRPRGLFIDFNVQGGNATIDGDSYMIELDSPGTPVVAPSGRLVGLKIRDLSSWPFNYSHAIAIESQSANPHQSKGNLWFEGGGYNTGHLVLYDTHLWSAAANQLRVKTNPGFATDGQAIILESNSKSYGVAVWVANGVSCADACDKMMDQLCNNAWELGASDSDCSSTTGRRVCECY